MFKKSLLAAVVATVAIASVDAGCSKFEGAYVGVGVSVAQDKAEIKGSFATTLKGQVDTKNNFKDTNFSASLLGGYNFKIANNNFLGLEADLSYRGFKVSGIKKTWGSLVGVRYGYQFTDSAAVFVGLGVDYARYQSGTVKTSKFGIAPSFGAEMNLTNNMFAGLRYTYVKTAQIKNNIKLNATPVFGDRDGVVKTKLTQHKFTLSLGYRF